MYDIVSAIETSVSYDMIPHNISAWHDISMMWYDARMVYYCNESIWYQNISVLYDVSERYDISVWHDTTAVWYNILSQAWITGVMTYRCFQPSACWPFGAPVFGVWGFHKKMQSYWRYYTGSYERFRTTKKSNMLSRGSFSSLLVRNDTTQLGASFIVDVYLLLRF